MNEQDLKFADIRPLLPEELPEAIEQLFDDEQFLGVLKYVAQDVPPQMLKAKLLTCPDNLAVQKALFYPLVKKIEAEHSKGVTMDASALSAEARKQSYTFISNHRDIVLDPAFLDILLIDNGFGNTVEIAIGDNLLAYPWIKTLVRVNKSFIVRRSLGMRELLAASKHMSEYMHYALGTKHENLWIAQREGRAKDSDDRTQESVLKMLTMGGEGTPADRLKRLNVIPLAISYEYDPCDGLKAKEFQQKRDNPAFRKSRQDDLLNMQTGIFGYKGRVKYRIAAPINTWIDELAGLPKNEFYKAVAERMDREIHRNYELYPNNYAALDMLSGHNAYADHYTAEEKAAFEKYLNERIAQIDLPEKDEAFLRERILTMYANPLRNHLAAL